LVWTVQSGGLDCVVCRVLSAHRCSARGCRQSDWARRDRSPLDNGGGGSDEQPSKLQPTSVVSAISVAPGAEELLSNSAQAGPSAEVRTPSTTRLSTM
jgi:hypothetical protein